jgi:hypothetical protein
MSEQSNDAGNAINRHYNRAIYSAGVGLVGFFLCLVISVFILPEGLRTNRGFSYYGDMPETRLLYRLAFVICGACMLLSSVSLPRTMPFKVIRVALWLMFPLLFGVVLTTGYPGNPVIVNIHRAIGVTLFVTQVALASWLALFVCRDRLNLTLYVLLLLGGVLSLLGLLGILRYLIQGQVLFLLAFGAVLVYSLVRLRVRVGALG